MTKPVYLFFVVCVILNEVSTQTLESLTSSPVTIQNPKSSSSSTESKWQELLPTLQTIKSTSKIKKEKLYNIVKIIKFLLSEEMESNNGEALKMMEKIKDSEDIFEGPAMPDFESIVEERLKSIKEVIDDRNYMAEGPEMMKELTIVKTETEPKNKTADFSKILSKISAALAKVKEQNQSSDTKTPTTVPIFRKRGSCNNDFIPPSYETRQLGNAVSGQTGINPMSGFPMFNIPCQRASDILEETANFQLPAEMFCDNPAVNLNSLAKNAKFNLDNLPFKNIVPNSVSCVDSEDTVAILFKPKTISLMQMYGNLLKKVTMTVLVPYHVTKLAI